MSYYVALKFVLLNFCLDSLKIIALKLYDYIAFNDRLQEKLSNMESENQILRQQSLMHSPVKRMSEHLSIPTTPTKQAVIVL